MEATKIS